MKYIFRISLAVVVCLALWTGALATRRAVFHQQTRTLGDQDAPFLMESGLQFRMTRMVAENGTLPERDEYVQVPMGVNMRETYSVGAEWIYNAFSDWLPSSWSFARRIRWVSTGLFCLAVPFMTLLVKLRSGSWIGACTTGAVLVFSPAFAVRSSGLELSRENLAIPLFCLFLLAEANTRRCLTDTWKGRVWALMAVFSLAWAQCVWDLTQYVTGCWVVWRWICLWKGEKEHPTETFLVLGVALSQVGVALINPYLRVHGYLFSPVIALLVARAIVMIPVSFFQRRVVRIALVPVSIALWQVLGMVFVENYSHFGELFAAKLQFLNEKPMDPGRLIYAQRIMWTPALNSATWTLTKSFLPVSLFTFVAAAIYLVRERWQGRKPGWPEFFYAGLTLPLYVFFFRFHVFLIVFMAVAIGCVVGDLARKSKRYTGKILPLFLMVLLPGVTSYHLLFFEPASARKLRVEQQQLMTLFQQMGADIEPGRGNRWGRPGISYSELASLMEMLQETETPGPVLANFGVSASILTETGRPILLHPKFETPGIRERVRQFYHHLFLETEKEFRDWAISEGASLYVHSNGSLAEGDTRNSPRYMVDALNPPDEAAVHVLERNPQDAVWFFPVASNRKYRIYRIITPEDVEWAERLTRLARIDLLSGDFERAARRARMALEYHWKYVPARETLKDALNAPGAGL